MATPNAATSSPWSLDSTVRAAAPLAGNTRYDVCVIGGGIAGLTAAYLLASEGKSVALLDGKPLVAAGETEFTTAHLAWVLDDRFSRVASIRGDEAAQLAAESHKSAIDLIEEIVRRESIACDFKRLDGYLFPGADGPDALRDEMLAATRLGLLFERVDRVPFPAGGPGPAMRFPGNAQFHPLKYLTDLAGLICQKGGVIHTETRVVKVDSGSPCVAHTTAGNAVTADARGGRHRRAVRLRRDDAPEGGGVPDVRGGAGGGAGVRPARALLGHRGPVPLRPHRAGE